MISLAQWIYPAFLKGCQLPISIFHLNRLSVLHERWQMSWDGDQRAPSPARARCLSKPLPQSKQGDGQRSCHGGSSPTPEVSSQHRWELRYLSPRHKRCSKMTGFEAAIQEERNATVRHRREVTKTQEDHGYRSCYLKEATASIAECYSQQDLPVLYLHLQVSWSPCPSPVSPPPPPPAKTRQGSYSVLPTMRHITRTCLPTRYICIFHLLNIFGIITVAASWFLESSKVTLNRISCIIAENGLLR